MPERQGGHDFSRAVKTKAFRASVPEETGCPTSRAFRDVGERHPHSAFTKQLGLGKPKPYKEEGCPIFPRSLRKGGRRECNPGAFRVGWASPSTCSASSSPRSPRWCAAP